MDIKIFRSNKEDMELFSREIQYWSNGLGEIHNGGVSICEEELPAELQRAYKVLWTDEFGSLCYLVETPKGYGVALLNEYDNCYADDCNLNMDKLFQSALEDSKVISKRVEFQNTDIYIGEHSGFCKCHELIVVFPASTPVDEFRTAAVLLDELAYQTAKHRNFSLTEQIESASNRASVLSTTQNSTKREAVNTDSIHVTLSRKELALIKESLDVMGDRYADKDGYSSGEVYWDLKDKLDSLEHKVSQSSIPKAER